MFWPSLRGHLEVNMAGRDRVRERPLWRDQIDSEYAGVSQTNDREGRCPVGWGGHYGSFDSICSFSGD